MNYDLPKVCYIFDQLAAATLAVETDADIANFKNTVRSYLSYYFNDKIEITFEFNIDKTDDAIVVEWVSYYKWYFEDNGDMVIPLSVCDSLESMKAWRKEIVEKDILAMREAELKQLAKFEKIEREELERLQNKYIK
jgi:hypothetical protein